MKIAIKNPAPDDSSGIRWGDYHFGNSLLNAFHSINIPVIQDFWPNWSVDHGEDVVIVLRGLRQYQPPSHKLKILWVLSHPAMISRDELNSYDLIYCASETLAFLLKGVASVKIKVLPQCTDGTRFFSDSGSFWRQEEQRSGTIYVANSRGVRRDVAWWASQYIDDVRIYGGGWGYFGLQKHVVRDIVSNDSLPDLYRSARLGLNDHWVDMRHFGLINNRIFDCLACGLPVISDSFPELRKVFGDVVIYADTETEFRDAVAYLNGSYSDVLSAVYDFWGREGQNYTFDTRVAQILEDINVSLQVSSEVPPRHQVEDDQQWLPVFWKSLQENARYHENQVEGREKIIANMRRQFDSEFERQRKVVEEAGRYALTLERELERLRKSVSWRLTAPLRWLKSVYRRARRRPLRNNCSIRNRRPMIVEEIERRRSGDTH